MSDWQCPTGTRVGGAPAGRSAAAALGTTAAIGGWQDIAVREERQPWEANSSI